MEFLSLLSTDLIFPLVFLFVYLSVRWSQLYIFAEKLQMDKSKDGNSAQSKDTGRIFGKNTIS